jgi:putative DNA primase/helicase
MEDAEEFKRDATESKKPARAFAQPHWEVEPWHEPVVANELVDEIVARVKRHVVLSDDAALTVALWVAFSWLHDAAVHSPILLVSSPEAECGKSTLLGLVGLLTPRGFVVVELSTAIIYRVIEAWRPTFVVDEADDAFKNNSELRAVVNSGWTRGAGVPRCHPKTHEPEFFNTFGPKAIGLKGLNLPGTTLSRSIIIEMQRKLPGEEADDFAHEDDAHLAELRRRLARFADDTLEGPRIPSPRMPEGFNNRLAANWRLMLAIADLCGPRMAERARAAAVALSRRADEASLGVELLRDIRDIRDLANNERIASADLATKLADMADRPWAEMPYSHKPITQPQLARLLRSYGVKPKTIRFSGERTAKGYEFAWFESAFRYIPTDTPQNARNTVTTADFSQKCRNKPEANVTGEMADFGQCYAVTPDLEGRAHSHGLDLFEEFKDDSLRLKPLNDYPDLPPFLDRRVAQGGRG